MYYVYEWFIVETGEIIYVGKGCRNRYKVRKHNRFFNDMINRFECQSRIVKEFQSEKEAFEYEFQRVFELKLKGQCVCNINNGGAGGTTNWWNSEKRKAYSERNVMKSEKQRKRMSENNPMKSKRISEKVAKTKQRAVIIDGIRYSSIKQAQQYFGVSFETIKTWCKKGQNKEGKLCRYEDSDQVVFSGKRYNKGGCREIVYKNKLYESPIDLAKEINVCNSTICEWTKRGFDPNGNICRYTDDDRKLAYIPNRNSDLHSKPIIVNGVRYNSKKEAEEKLGLKKGYLAPYIAGIRKNNKYICEYDNQQASGTKSDNSSTEASTTNE